MLPFGDGVIKNFINMTKAIIFDVDGVVFKTHNEDSKYLWSRTIKKDLGITSQHFSEIFSDKWIDILTGKITFKKHLNDVVKKDLFKEINFSPEKYIDYWLAKDHNLNLGLLEVVKSLKIPCYLGTNQEMLRTSHIIKSVGEYFQGCFPSYKVGYIKPEVEFFSHIEKSLELKPQELLLIDDLKENIMSADKCGWKTYHYKNDTRDLQVFLSAL